MSDRSPSKPSAVPDVVGAVLGGKFRVGRVLGQGGMGVVVEATNIGLDERVAIKLLRADTERSDETVEAFTREVRAASKLRSEHVARVLDVGADAAFGPFMVMELLEGFTLQQVLSSTGRLPPQRAVEYGIMACEALAEAHARGIVHRDVKPANLFVVRGPSGRPVLKVLDFGIATVTLPGRIADGSASKNRHGSPHYLSPEQLRTADTVDSRADVWALGCVLFELLTGAKAFDAPRFTALVAKILEEDPAPVPEDVVDMPEGLLAVVHGCLEKDRDTRYATIADLALALLPFARARAHSVVVRAVAHVREAGMAPELVVPSTMPPPPSGGGADLVSSQSLRAPSVPRVSVDGVASSPREVTESPEPTSQRSRLILGVAAAAALVAVAAGVASSRRHGAEVEPPVRSSQPPPSVSSSVVPVQTAPPARSVPPPAVELAADAGPSASVSARPTARPPIYTWPPKPAASQAPAPASAPAVSNGEGEIRSTR